jgi:hypothetical protein
MPHRFLRSCVGRTAFVGDYRGGTRVRSAAQSRLRARRAARADREDARHRSGAGLRVEKTETGELVNW